MSWSRTLQDRCRGPPSPPLETAGLDETHARAASALTPQDTGGRIFCSVSQSPVSFEGATRGVQLELLECTSAFYPLLSSGRDRNVL